VICRFCGAALPPTAMFCGECGRAVSGGDPVPPPPPAPEQPEPRVPQAPMPSASPVPPPPPAPERFVLQFSTGESVTVSGTGLIGRNPAPEPGEYFDLLVPIFDAGRSVSKTHLEFGQEDGRLWVGDRYSTNGTTIRRPGAEPRSCRPGTRYFVERGTRVELGDEFFVVG